MQGRGAEFAQYHHGHFSSPQLTIVINSMI